jgi:hypothetical protein
LYEQITGEQFEYADQEDVIARVENNIQSALKGLSD